MQVIGGIQGKRAFFEMQKWGVGTVLRPGENPEGRMLPHGIEDAIVLNPDIPRIDAENWTAVQRLYIHCIENNPGENNPGEEPHRGQKRKNPYKFGGNHPPSNEVAVIFCLAEDRSHWIVIAAKQEVGGASVHEDRTQGGINIRTGERYSMIPPPGYDEFGTGHSHNTMRLDSFSGVDDRNELHLNGWHILCSSYHKDKGGIWQYTITPSVVAGGRRYMKFVNTETWKIRTIQSKHLVDCAWRDDTRLHPDTLEFIRVHRPRLTAGKMVQRPASFFDWEMWDQPVRIPASWKKETPVLPFSLPDGDYAMKTWIAQELEEIKDCIDHLEMLTDRTTTADLVAGILNKMELWRKINPRANP